MPGDSNDFLDGNGTWSNPFTLGQRVDGLGTDKLLTISSGGLLAATPMFPGTSTEYLDGSGAWSVPAGAITVGAAVSGSTHNALLKADGSGNLASVTAFSGSASQYLDGSGAWSVPAGTPTIGQSVVGSTNNTVLTVDNTGKLSATAAYPGTATQFLDGTGAWSTPVCCMASGHAVGGATANAILYADGSGNLAMSGNFLLATGLSIQATAAGGAGNFVSDDGTKTATLAYHSGGTVYAATFSDGIHTVKVCDGVNSVSYTPAAPANWAGAPPTDIWTALDRLAAWIAAGAAIPPFKSFPAKP
jgi:hypothetical protein